MHTHHTECSQLTSGQHTYRLIIRSTINEVILITVVHVAQSCQIAALTASKFWLIQSGPASNFPAVICQHSQTAILAKWISPGVARLQSRDAAGLEAAGSSMDTFHGGLTAAPLDCLATWELMKSYIRWKAHSNQDQNIRFDTGPVSQPPCLSPVDFHFLLFYMAALCRHIVPLSAL